ncbi:MAG: sensor histidine kinase [Polaromonas sp.]
MTSHSKRRSLRRYLLLGILLPVGLLIGVNTISLYSDALAAINTAYDRTLLASTKSIGEQLDVTGFDAQSTLRVTVPYAALEAFEADNQSRLFYRVSSLSGALVSGYDQLPFWRGQISAKPAYAALVDFYDDVFEGTPVRVAVLMQPVASSNGRAMAVIQVAETLELRQSLARTLLFDTLWRQALLLGVIALVVMVVVQRATRPVRRLSLQLQSRPEGDLNPISAPDAPRELMPLVDATNAVMTRLANLLEHQKRFVRDAAHQLRTPLAVLKVQVQSAMRGDQPPNEALADINQTVDRATLVANQMLALAKVEQLRQQPELKTLDLAEVMRAVALDLSALMADKNIDFAIDTVAAPMAAHEWMLTELTRNLLHNAIKHTPAYGGLTIRIVRDATHAALSLSDSGPGIDAELAARLFQPFSAGNVARGSGLGLAICKEIVAVLGGTISLDNRVQHGVVTGLDATVRLPLLT